MTTPLILTIDDDEDFNNLLKVKLGSLGINVVATDTPDKFFKFFQNEKPDVCLIDLNLGDLYGAGYQVIQAIRNKIEDPIPLITLSKRSSRDDINKSLGLGANDHISKPIDILILEYKLREYIKLSVETPGLPFFEIDSKESDINFSLDISLKQVKLSSMSFKSNTSFIPKSTFTVSSDLIEEITQRPQVVLTVKSCEKLVSEEFMIEGGFSVHDEDLMAAVREWIIENI